MIYNLDDYHNIHEKRHPNCTSLSEATHMATCISKKIENSNHIPIIYRLGLNSSKAYKYLSETFGYLL